MRIQRVGMRKIWRNSIVKVLTFVILVILPIFFCTNAAEAKSTDCIYPNICYIDSEETILVNESDRIDALLVSIESNKSKLPEGFPVELFLAIAFSETGENYNWNNNLPGGIMQIEKQSGFQTRMPYDNTYAGINNNVLDAIDAINFFYRNKYRINFSNDQYLALWGLPGENYYGYNLKAALTTLAYNAGFDPISVYNQGLGNSQYTYAIGFNLKYYVPKVFGEAYRNDKLADSLMEFQKRMDEFYE